MLLTISRADFGDPALAPFLQSHLDDMAPTAPSESRHALDLTALQQPSVRLWVGHLDGTLVVTGALARLDEPDLDQTHRDQPHPETTIGGGEGRTGTGEHSSNEEIKSMRTDPATRGRGLGRAMLHALIADARSRGVQTLWLETGSMPFFAPARALYLREGFVECEPFGAYVTDPHSTFMKLAL